MVFGVISLVTAFLFCGIARDPEFYEPTIFVKYRPTLKVHFYTPIGESDMTLSDLTEDKKREEMLYQEFVENQGVYAEGMDRLWFLPFILTQLTLTFGLGTIGPNVTKPRSLIIHFFLNIIPTTALVGLMFLNEKPWQLLGLGALLLVVNILTMRVTRRKGSTR